MTNQQAVSALLELFTGSSVGSFIRKYPDNHTWRDVNHVMSEYIDYINSIPLPIPSGGDDPAMYD